MKTANTQPAKRNWLRAATMMASAGFLSMIAVACGSNGGGGSSGTYIAPYSPYAAAISCSGCPTNPALIVSAISDVGTPGAPQAELALQFYGDAAVMQQSAAYGTTNYQGVVAATGYLYLATGLPACGVPAGTYQMTTAQPGIWGLDGAGQSFNNLVLGSTTAPFSVYLGGFTVAGTASRGMDGNTYPYRMAPAAMVVKPTSAYAACNLSINQGIGWQ